MTRAFFASIHHNAGRVSALLVALCVRCVPIRESDTRRMIALPAPVLQSESTLPPAMRWYLKTHEFVSRRESCIRVPASLHDILRRVENIKTWNRSNVRLKTTNTTRDIHVTNKKWYTTVDWAMHYWTITYYDNHAARSRLPITIITSIIAFLKM